MKKIIITIFTGLLLTNTVHALVGGLDIKDPWNECKTSSSLEIEAGACRIINYSISLPTILIGDQTVDQNSPEYQAIVIDQAIRTMNGETTLLFGSDVLKATELIQSIQLQK